MEQDLEVHLWGSLHSSAHNPAEGVGSQVLGILATGWDRFASDVQLSLPNHQVPTRRMDIAFSARA